MVTMPKFMQTLDEEIYNQFQDIANGRGMTIQELIRGVLILDWLKETEKKWREDNEEYVCECYSSW